MRRRTDNGARHGFTMVELLIAGLAVSVLAVTIGSMLFFAMKHMRNNAVAVELQRDATFALDMLYRALQGASPSQVTFSGSTLTLATNAVRNDVQQFTVSGSSLIYDPDTGTAGDDVVLIPGRVTSFAVGVDGSMAHITLSLQEGDESLTVTSNRVYLRYIE